MKALSWNILLVSLAVVLVSACSPTPIIADQADLQAQATDTIVPPPTYTSAVETDQEVDALSNAEPDTTPTTETDMTPYAIPEATEIEEELEYLDTDFTITPEMIEKMSGRDVKKGISVLIRSNDLQNYPYQYQIWVDGREKVPLVYWNFPYDKNIDGESLITRMGLSQELEINSENDLKCQILDQAMESGYYLDSSWLDDDVQSARATVVYVAEEGDMIVPYSLNDGGMVFYIDNGEVKRFKGNEIPSDLPENVKEKFLEKYVIVSVNGDTIKTFGQLTN